MDILNVAGVPSQDLKNLLLSEIEPSMGIHICEKLWDAFLT